VQGFRGRAGAADPAPGEGTFCHDEDRATCTREVSSLMASAAATIVIDDERRRAVSGEQIEQADPGTGQLPS